MAWEYGPSAAGAFSVLTTCLLIALTATVLPRFKLDAGRVQLNAKRRAKLDEHRAAMKSC
jgi:hypothetical protein